MGKAESQRDEVMDAMDDINKRFIRMIIGGQFTDVNGLRQTIMSPLQYFSFASPTDEIAAICMLMTPLLSAEVEGWSPRFDVWTLSVRRGEIESADDPRAECLRSVACMLAYGDRMHTKTSETISFAHAHEKPKGDLLLPKPPIISVRLLDGIPNWSSYVCLRHAEVNRIAILSAIREAYITAMMTGARSHVDDLSPLCPSWHHVMRSTLSAIGVYNDAFREHIDKGALR